MRVIIVSLIQLKNRLRQAFFISLFIFSGVFLATSLFAADGVRVFIESNDSLVVMQDMSVPEAKSYDHVVVLNGKLDFLGKTKTLTVVNGSVHLGDSAEIFDKLVLVNGSITQSPGAKAPNVVGGGSVGSWATGEVKERWSSLRDRWEAWKQNLESGNFLGFLAIPFAALLMIAVVIVLAAVGVVLFFLAPSLSYRADRVLRKSPFISVLWGFAGYIAVMPILVLMILSIIGILVTPFYILFVLLVAFAGLFAGCRGLGMFVLERFGGQNVVMATFLGLLIVFASLWAPLVGNLFFSIVWIAGTGALLRSFFVSDDDSRFINVEFQARSV